MKMDTMVQRFIVILTLILMVVLAWDSVYAENKVLSLDGDGDYVQIPASVWFNGDLTIEAWVYVKEYRSWSRLIDFGNGADRDNVFVTLTREATGIPGLYIAKDQFMETSIALELNSWTHIACTLKGNSGSLFINGYVVGQGNFDSRPRDVERQKNFIGRSNGKIEDDSHAMFDEIRIWNVSRSETDIQDAMNTSLSGDEKGLLGYWNFDDGTAEDLTANGHDGEMEGDAQIVNLNDLPVGITIEDNVCKTAKELVINISIQNLGQKAKMTFDLVFDPSILQANAVVKGDEIISWLPPKIDNHKGVISLISWDNDGLLNNMQHETELAAVTFLALKKGKTNLEVRNQQLTLADGSNRLVETGIGTINILPKGSSPLFEFLERENLFTDLFWRVATCSIAALFGFLYFSIYLFDPTKEEHLYFSIIMLVISVTWMSGLILDTSDTYDNNGILVGLATDLTPPTVALAMTRFFYSMQYKKLPVRFFPHFLYISYRYLAFFSNFYFDLNLYFLPSSIASFIYVFLWIVDLYWMFKYPTKPKAAGFNILIIGMCIYSLLVIYWLLTRIFFLIPDFIPFLPPDGGSHLFIIFILTMAIFLAKNIQSTNLSLKQLTQNLETRIEERTFELTQTNQKLLKSEKEARDELADANDMQVALLPKSAPVIPRLQIAGSSIAAKEVGGDFFDYLIPEDNQQISIAVGDVSGKGLRGAMNAVMSSGILRLASSENPGASMDLLMSKTNKALCNSMEQDMNVTMVLAQFDNAKRQMTLANAGQHAYPLLIRNSSIEPVKAKGMALGMIPNIPYKPTTIDLEPGDLLLFMTDGITEPRNADGVMYEESGRMNEVLSSIPIEMPIEEVLNTLISDVKDYTTDEEQDDDITLVAVRVV